MLEYLLWPPESPHVKIIDIFFKYRRCLFFWHNICGDWYISIGLLYYPPPKQFILDVHCPISDFQFLDVFWDFICPSFSWSALPRELSWAYVACILLDLIKRTIVYSVAVLHCSSSKLILARHPYLISRIRLNIYLKIRYSTTLSFRISSFFRVQI